jgi:mannose/cellobiose epimerase-like protein (N-acyl-D-glucosamine 2-epimerase family)
MTVPMRPEFRSNTFLRSHMQEIINFYTPICINEAYGGYYNAFRDDGSIYDRETQHLVSTTRFIFNYCTAFEIFGRQEYLAAAQHGIDYLIVKHLDSQHGGYFWVMKNDQPSDTTKTCYGHAFVLLAFASAAKAGLIGAKERVEETYQLLETRFWNENDRVYVDEVNRDWSQVSPYRGQNANMHMTEAMLAAYEATGDEKFLDRAETLAFKVCVELADKAGGMVWEHYHEDWSIDWQYNKDDPHNLFKPYGFLPGHMTEWTKLLLLLERHRPRDWILPKAVQLYEAALARAADLEHGGLHYSFGPDGKLYDLDKYHWVHCETLAAAAGLAVRTGLKRYWQDYDRLWAYSWQHFIDHQYGCWFRVLSPDGKKHDDKKSPPGKTDYHPFGACYEILRILEHAK